MNKSTHVDKTDLFSRVTEILERTRSKTVRTVNFQMVIAYWCIGREIVEEEQQGADHAGYGEFLIKDLAQKLTKHYGKGFSPTNLKYFRQFYLTYRRRRPEIGHAPRDQSPDAPGGERKRHAARDRFDSNLTWTHYRMLLKVENEKARFFYEIEAAKNRWSSRQLERQISSLLFERLSRSRDKKGVLKLAREGQTIDDPLDAIKDPYVLEFLDLPESHRLVESKLEEALITHLQDFLLELGSGFAFVGRQKRLTLKGDHFYPDLVFYHIKLKCYVIIDLKAGKLSPGDLGQMQMYVHYYDREVRTADDNPTIGLILCTSKNDAMVQYVLDERTRQIFTSRYKLELPTEKQLRNELMRERGLLESHSSFDGAGRD